MGERDSPLFSFAILADTHLTKDEAVSAEGREVSGDKLAALYDDMVGRINAMRPAFVVHLGDITDPVPVSTDFSDSAQAFHKASQVFSMPYYLVPGNHDVGEKIHPALPKVDDQVSITKRAIEQYEQHFGQQRYSFEVEGCLFLVINSLLLNSGLAEEREQWTWLEQTLLDHAGKRIFVFAHYPLYLSAKDEPGYYDNIDEPGRSRLLDLLEQYRVEGYYAGHVHNFFYNLRKGMHQFVLPSTGIIRHDYMEFFRDSPTRDMGRFDPAKLGFFWVEVFAEGHVPHFIRTSDIGGSNARSGEESALRTHSWNAIGATVTVDLRLPWCEEADIPTPWGLEIFERKLVRNDYPLAALWEMGIRDLRIPISDLLNPRVLQRVKDLSALGHGFTVVLFGPPDAARRAVLADPAVKVKAVEVVALLDQWSDFAQPLQELREDADFEVYLHAVRPEVEGWTTHHGLHVDLQDEIDWVLRQDQLSTAVDGFVFGTRRGMSPVEGYEAVAGLLAGTGYKPLFHIPCVAMDWVMKPNDALAAREELARVAEALLLARAKPELSFVIDNFVQLDRGYCNCSGLVDRLYNPKDGSRLVASLNALLPAPLGKLTSYEIEAGRVLSAEGDGGLLFLLTGSGAVASTDLNNPLPEKIATTPGHLTDLVTGRTIETTLRAAIEARAGERQTTTPALLRLDDVGILLNDR